MATRIIYGVSCGRFYFYHLVCGEDLPNWNFDVWQKAFLERNDKMGIQKIKKIPAQKAGIFTYLSFTL